MFGYLSNIPVNLEVPAPAVVGGVLFVAALTKGGHPGWGIGGVIALYILCALYLAIRNSTRRAGIHPQPLGASGL
jgi:hypothetical protein